MEEAWAPSSNALYLAYTYPINEYGSFYLTSHSSGHAGIAYSCVCVCVCVMWQRWTDDYLSWEPNDYGGVDELIVPPSNIWLPDFGIANRSAPELNSTRLVSS